MATNSIAFTLINPALIKDSSDKVRNTFGGYHDFVEDDDGSESYSYSTSSGVDASGPIVDYDESDLFLQSIRSTITTASADVFNTNLSVNVVVAGREDAIENDEHWKKILVGGEYNTSSYDGVYTSGLFENFFVKTEIPYELYSVKTMVESAYADYDTISVGYKYNYHERSYESYISGRSTYEIPSLYLLNEVYEQNPDGFEPEIINFINLEGDASADALKDLFNVSSGDYPPFEEGSEVQDYPTTTQWKSNVANYKNYLSLYQNASLSGSTLEFLTSNSSNIIIDNDILNIVDDSVLESLPFYTHVSIPAGTITTGSVNNLIDSYSLKNLMMKTIKERFVDNSATIETENFKFWQQADQLIDGKLETGHGTVTAVDYRNFDLLPTILNDIKSPTRNSRNLTCLTNDAIEQHVVTDINGVYRHIKNTRMMGFATELVEDMGVFGTTFSTALDLGSLSDILEYANTPNQIESIGYRIQKIGGTPRGTQRSVNTLCNYYIFDDGDDIDLYDTQVKYGANYRYNVYQYVAVIGYRYNYKNFAGTRQIGKNDHDDDSTTEDKNCLEFYDLITGREATRTDPRETVPDIYDPLDTDNTFATDAQVLSFPDYPYLCEFDIVIEPYIKIIEIPLSTKETQVMDHPPRKVEIMSYQRKDNSQTIGFYAKYESFEPQPYPLTISDEDQNTKNDYMVSNNLYAGEEITQESTRPVAVEVYRIDKKPTTMRDFRGALIATKDLTNLKFDTPVTDCFYEQRIRTNTKYYYLFRFLNAHNMPGHTSPVVEAELVDDGGYKYSLFDVISDSEITDEPPVDAPSKPFKKLLQMKLQSSHLILDDEGVDYEGNASDSIKDNKFIVGNADDPIWGKTFKIRMTSKKTGKKLDINVTYKVNSL